MQNLTVRLAEGIIADLEQEADEHGGSRSEYICKVKYDADAP